MSGKEKEEAFPEWKHLKEQQQKRDAAKNTRLLREALATMSGKATKPVKVY